MKFTCATAPLDIDTLEKVAQLEDTFFYSSLVVALCYLAVKISTRMALCTKLFNCPKIAVFNRINICCISQKIFMTCVASMPIVLTL